VEELSLVERLFSESCSRFVLEVKPESFAAVQAVLGGVPHAVVGAVTATGTLTIRDGDEVVVEESVEELRTSWRGALDW
jgi:Phosphoribosylformylglycinamidine (FGAM) synthase, synthetase domain